MLIMQYAMRTGKQIVSYACCVWLFSYVLLSLLSLFVRLAFVCLNGNIPACGEEAWRA